MRKVIAIFGCCIIAAQVFAADLSADRQDKTAKIEDENKVLKQKIARLEQVISQLTGTLDKGTQKADWIYGSGEPSGTATSADVIEGKTFCSAESLWTQNTGTRTDTLAGGATDSGQIIVTGQTTCYDSAGNVIACLGTGDWPGQDGYYQEGLPFNFDTTEYAGIKDSVVLDKNTGLMWARNGNGRGCYSGGTRTWSEALRWAEGLTFCGYSDWRLPNVRELESIVDCGEDNPAIDTTYFPHTQSSNYWSSTTYHYYPSYAWYVYFYGGSVGTTDKAHVNYVRAVRGCK